MFCAFRHLLAVIQLPDCQIKYLMNHSILLLYKYSELSHLECSTWKRWCLNTACLPTRHGLVSLVCMSTKTKKDSLCPIPEPWQRSKHGFYSVLSYVLEPWIENTHHQTHGQIMMTFQESQGDKAWSLEKLAQRSRRSSGPGKGSCCGQCGPRNKYRSIHPDKLEKGKLCFNHCNVEVRSRH